MSNGCFEDLTNTLNVEVPESFDLDHGFRNILLTLSFPCCIQSLRLFRGFGPRLHFNLFLGHVQSCQSVSQSG